MKERNIHEIKGLLERNIANARAEKKEYMGECGR